MTRSLVRDCYGQGSHSEVKYQLVSRKEILVRDARLAAKDPDRLVYARFRTLHYSLELRMNELKDGKWVDGPRACGGTA